MDHHFFTKHPAVQHVLQQYPEHFKGHEEQAIFPAFWLHWLTIPHHERLRGMPHVGFNGGTDHYPFWASIKHVLGKHYIPHEDSSFDFGLNKSEPSDERDLLPIRTARAMHEIQAKHGEHAALGVHSYLLPALLSSEHAEHHWVEPTPEQVVRKFEALTIDLRKAVADLKKEPSAAPYGVARASGMGKPEHVQPIGPGIEAQPGAGAHPSRRPRPGAGSRASGERRALSRRAPGPRSRLRAAGGARPRVQDEGHPEVAHAVRQPGVLRHPAAPQARRARHRLRAPHHP
jgi:hypothetical protein